MEFQPCKGKPNSHAWNIQRLFRSNRLPFIPGRGTGPPQATVGPYAHQLCNTYVCSATTWPYSCPQCGMHSRTSVHEKNQITSGGRYVHLPADWLLGLPLYHISQHVASTFKRLATTTTRCDLNNFYQNRQGKPPGHGIAHDPIHYP
jgi:hypothetical protein